MMEPRGKCVRPNGDEGFWFFADVILGDIMFFRLVFAVRVIEGFDALVAIDKILEKSVGFWAGMWILVQRYKATVQDNFEQSPSRFPVHSCV